MTDLLQTTQEHLLQEQVETLVLLEAGQDNTLLEPVQELVLLTEAQQGPPGPPGAPGQAGVSYVTFKAQEAIGGHRVVYAVFSGGVRYADSRNPACAMAVIGLSLHAAEQGDFVNVANAGEVVEPSWNWVQGLPIFVGVDGVPTQVPPDTGFQLVVAVATSPTSALLSIKQPIVI